MKRVVGIMIGLSAVCAKAEPLRIDVAYTIEKPNQFIEDGRPVGLLFDVADEVWRRAGFAPHYVELPWARLYESLIDGRIDGAIGVFALGEGRRRALYSTPIMIQYAVLLRRRGEGAWPKRLADLRGMMIGGQLGLDYNALRGDPEIEIVRSRTLDLNLSKLLLGRIDGAIVGSITGLSRIRERADAHKFEAVATIETVPLGLALADERFDETDLALLNQVIAAVLRQGALDAAAERYGVSDFLMPPPLIR